MRFGGAGLKFVDGNSTHDWSVVERRVPGARLRAESHNHRGRGRSVRADRHADATGKKTIYGTCGTPHYTWYDRRPRRIRDLPCGDLHIDLAFDLRRVDGRRCGGVKQERLEWLTANPHDTKRFAWYVGKPCRGASVQEVASDLPLDWHAVKEMDKLYMREQLAVASVPRPAVIGQRLKPFEKFAALIERHWDGIAAYCEPQNKVALGFGEGLNNKIRVIQRRCYGLRDEEYLRLKILTSTLPPLPRT